MTVDIPVRDLVRQLVRAGLRPSARVAERILEAGQAVRGDLLALAHDQDALLKEEPTCWGPVHALRFLNELRDPTLIAPILNLFPVPIEYDQQPAPMIWSTDAAQLLGHIGAPAVEPLWQWFDNTDHSLASRSAAADGLAYLTSAAAALREPIIAGLRQRLAASDDRAITALIISSLARMAAADSYPDVLAAYRAGRVDSTLMPASDARQLLLGKGTPNLACVNHTFWERYDQHGPFPPQEE